LAKSKPVVAVPSASDVQQALSEALTRNQESNEQNNKAMGE
jgi:hypothetical protein